MSEPSPTSTWSHLLSRAIATWLPLAAVTTGLAVMVYAAVQQDLRLGADDTPSALARATSAQLDAGHPPSTSVPDRQVDLSRSLEPFVLIFDSAGHLLASSVMLHGQPPTYPSGVLLNANTGSADERRVTWQPEPGVRSATVVVAWQGGYVVAGRSLLLTEQHIAQIGSLIALGWLGTLALIAAAAAIAIWISPHHHADQNMLQRTPVSG